MYSDDRNGIILNLLPEERILHKAKHGRMVGGRLLPGMVVATNKRLLVYSPLGQLGSYSSVFYDSVSSIDVKHSILCTAFMINTYGKSKPMVVRFAKGAYALTLFGIISNQIAAVRNGDKPDGGFRAEHNYAATKIIDGTVPLNMNATYITKPNSDKQHQRTEIAKFARFEPTEKHRRRRPIAVVAKAEEVVQPISVASVTSFAQRLQNMTEARPQKQASLGSSISSYVEQLNTQKQEIPKTGAKRKLDPDKDLRIFRVRHVRKRIVKEHTVKTGGWNPFKLDQ